MKITDVLLAVQTILVNSGKVEYSEISKVEYFAPSKYPAVVIDPGPITEDSTLLQDDMTDYIVHFDVVYFEKVPIDESGIPPYSVLNFVEHVEDIIKLLRANPRLNNTINWFELSVDWADTTFEDNLEFIAQIHIKAMRR